MQKLLLTIVLTGSLSVFAYAKDDECEMLFVQDAKSMSFSGNQLTLKDANPNIIFFCDRPTRTAGHLTRDAFLKLVSEGENSFKDNPPNAAVSIFDGKDGVTAVVVVLGKTPGCKRRRYGICYQGA